MGNYTTQEFLDTFGGLPEPGDRQHAFDWRGKADMDRDRYYDKPDLPADHPGFTPCGHCGASYRADLPACVLCGTKP